MAAGLRAIKQPRYLSVVAMVTVLASCSSGQSNGTGQSSNPVDDDATVVQSIDTRLADPPEAVAPPPTTSSSAVAATTTVDPTASTRRTGLWEEGAAAAEALSAAFVDRDWATVRKISPTNLYTDLELENGYAGLVAQELVLVDRRAIDSDTIALYFMLFADEERPTPQTSTYCIRWDYFADTGTIVQQLGAFVDRIDGFARESLGAAWVCADLESESAQYPATAAVGNTLIGEEIDDPGVITFEQKPFRCEPPVRLLGVARACRSAFDHHHSS